MAQFIFGDTFDLYTLNSDAVGFWDAMPGSPSLGSNSRYGGQYLTGGFSTANWYIKSSGQDHPTHRLYVAIRNTTALQAVGNAGFYLQLNDGNTALCTIAFWSTGSIRLHTGTVTGAQIAEYPNAMMLVSEWFTFEFEIVIHPTAGSFTVRRNANLVNIFTATGLNTRGAGTNNHANRLAIGYYNNGSFQLDEILWRSDTAAIPWLGDIRGRVMSPNSDVSTQFTRFPPTPIEQSPYPAYSYRGVTIPYAVYTPITAGYTGTVPAVGIMLSVAYTGSVKCTVFADASNAPGAIIASSTGPLTNLPIGQNLFAFGTPFSVVRGTRYWIGLCFSASCSSTFQYDNVTIARSGATAYADFPVAGPLAPVITTLTSVHLVSLHIVVTVNSDLVREVPHDGSKTYVVSDTPGHADLYGVEALSPALSNILCVNTRALLQKSESFSANARVQLKSGATAVQGSNITLQQTWATSYRTDATDPNTGLPWTAATLNAVQVGPLIT